MNTSCTMKYVVLVPQLLILSRAIYLTCGFFITSQLLREHRNINRRYHSSLALLNEPELLGRKYEQSHDDNCHGTLAISLSNHNGEHWGAFCDDVDKALEGLVSPAPESFHVIHSKISQIDPDRDTDDFFVPLCILEDLKSLASYLVKPNYSIELYDMERDNGNILKWKVIPRGSDSFCIIYRDHNSNKSGKKELYHEYSILQLSQMALATNSQNDPTLLNKVHEIAHQAERRIGLTMGSDLRGRTSSDACFNFVLSGIVESKPFFQDLLCICIHELNRVGHRASFRSKYILHMVEKFAACDIRGKFALELYRIAGECLEQKDFSDLELIQSLKDGTFGLNSDRPLLWLWRFSARQRKVSIVDFEASTKKVTKNSDGVVAGDAVESTNAINWEDFFYDSSKPLVIDLGSGMGSSLLNLSTIISSDSRFANKNSLPIEWPGCNYVGADLNQNFVNFGNGIVSRDSRRLGRVNFFCLTADDFLTKLQTYPGPTAMVMIHFPSPYRLMVLDSTEENDSHSGNSQLPLTFDGFMVTRKLLESISELLRNSLNHGFEGDGILLFQTKCEDVAIHVKELGLSIGTLDCVKCESPVRNIDMRYKETSGKRPKRVDDWLRSTPSTERAEGVVWSSLPLLPGKCQPETEVQCNNEHTIIHRCVFQYTGE